MDPSTRLAFFRPQTNVTDMRLEKRFAVIVVNCMTVPDPPIRNLQCTVYHWPKHVVQRRMSRKNAQVTPEFLRLLNPSSDNFRELDHVNLR